LPLLDSLARVDDATALRLLTSRRRRRDPLGFGLGEVVALASPVVWIVVSEAAKRAANSAIDGGTKATRAGLRRLFGRRKPARTVPPLSREQIADVHAQVLHLSVHGGLSPELAGLLADSVAGRLALGRPAGSADRPEDKVG
jgi:hypothetical protein